MKCNACGYNDESNEDENNWMFWQFKDVNFQLERQEFTDEIDIMNGRMFVCPKCFTVKIIKRIEDDN
jgi:hypothetical protein